MTANQPPGSSSGAGEATATIVRYPNRRFYDSSQRKYVTLQEIANMVREGKNVSVRDSKTNDDLTSIILTQIILDQHPERMDLLPVPILHLMIRTNDVVLGMLREYFRQSLAYVDFWQRASSFTPLSASMEWLKALLPGGPAAPRPPNIPPMEGVSTPVDSPLPEAAIEPEKNDLLLQRIAELERRLNALNPDLESSKSARSEDQSKVNAPHGHRKPDRQRGQPRGNRGRSRS